MAHIMKAQVENGVVVNVAMFDSDNLPDWASSWVDAADDTAVGGTYDGVTFTPPPAPAPTEEEIRARRDTLLAESDWVVTKAIEQNAQDGLGVQIPVVWLDYRQALRDIPQQPGFPDNVTWPTAP
jgi:hypothetical protein